MKLKKEFEEWFLSLNSDFCQSELSLPIAQHDPKWTLCSDRLPTEAGRYLAIFCCESCVLKFDGDRWEYEIEYMCDETQKDVTLWMEIPPHPRKGKTG